MSVEGWCATGGHRDAGPREGHGPCGPPLSVGRPLARFDSAWGDERGAVYRMSIIGRESPFGVPARSGRDRRECAPVLSRGGLAPLLDMGARAGLERARRGPPGPADGVTGASPPPPPLSFARSRSDVVGTAWAPRQVTRRSVRIEAGGEVPDKRQECRELAWLRQFGSRLRWASTQLCATSTGDAARRPALGRGRSPIPPRVPPRRCGARSQRSGPQRRRGPCP